MWTADLGAELDAIPMLASEIGYGVFTPAPAELLRVLQVNLFRVAFGIPYFVFGVPPELLGDALAHRPPRTLALHGLSFAVLLLIAAGFAASARPRLRALHVCFAAYLALTLAYPGGAPYRFLLPWSPFLVFFFLCGARVAGATLAGLSRQLQGRRHFVGQAAAGCLALLLVVFAGLEAVRILGSDEREYYLREHPMDWGEARALEAGAQLVELLHPAEVPAGGAGSGGSGEASWLLPFREGRLVRRAGGDGSRGRRDPSLHRRAPRLVGTALHDAQATLRGV